MSAAQVLVVEDEAIVARSIQAELESMGYVVPAVASSGEEALQRAAETNPDIVLMDIVLKGDMDGIEISEEMRRRHDIPVVYLTAYADDHTLQRAKKTSPFGYLLKPYEERELHTTIQLALSKHRSERILREVQQWLASTLRCIGDGVIVTDATACISIVNPEAEKLTGWSQEEAVGRDLPDVFLIASAETNTPLANPATQALQSGSPVRLPEHCLFLTRDGRQIPIEGSVAPVYDERQNFTGFVLAFRDITARQCAEEARRRDEEGLRQRQKTEAIGRLAAGTADDFNRLLTAILGNLSVVLSSLPADDLNRDFLVTAEKAALQATEDVKRLLSFSRRSVMRLKRHDLNATVLDMVDLLIRLDSLTVIESYCAPDLWGVQADPAQINEVLLNLCLNARDAMPNGGRLLLQTENVVIAEDSGRRHRQSRPGEFVCLRVCDTGRGMSEEVRSRLFEPFFTTKSAERSAGWGLAVAFGIIEQHGGWIECASEVDKGTRFEIFVPRDEPANAAPSEVLPELR